MAKVVSYRIDHGRASVGALSLEETRFYIKCDTLENLDMGNGWLGTHRTNEESEENVRLQSRSFGFNKTRETLLVQ